MSTPYEYASIIKYIVYICTVFVKFSATRGNEQYHSNRKIFFYVLMKFTAAGMLGLENLTFVL